VEETPPVAVPLLWLANVTSTASSVPPERSTPMEIGPPVSEADLLASVNGMVPA
jgi:hypothetical protein